jgi:hypothetical protein
MARLQQKNGPDGLSNVVNGVNSRLTHRSSASFSITSSARIASQYLRSELLTKA